MSLLLRQTKKYNYHIISLDQLYNLKTVFVQLLKIRRTQGYLADKSSDSIAYSLVFFSLSIC